MQPEEHPNKMMFIEIIKKKEDKQQYVILFISGKVFLHAVNISNMDIKKTKVFSIVLLLIIGMIAVPFSYAQSEKTLDNPSSSSSTTNTNLTVNYLSEKQVKEHYNSTGKLKPPTPVPLDVKTRQYKLVADGNNLYLIALLNNSTTKQLQLSKYDKDTFKETNKINLTYPNLKIDYILHLDAVSFNDTLYVVWQQINGNTSSVYLAENKNDTNKNSFNVFQSREIMQMLLIQLLRG